jgi:hypothetical protein
VEERPLNKFGSNVCTNGWQNHAKWLANQDQTIIGHLFYKAYIWIIVHHNIEQVNIVHT